MLQLESIFMPTNSAAWYSYNLLSHYLLLKHFQRKILHLYLFLGPKHANIVLCNKAVFSVLILNEELISNYNR